MGYLAELDKIAAGDVPVKPTMEATPAIKQYKCLVAMRCDTCGHEEYRYPRFVQGLSGRAIDEVRLDELCGYMHGKGTPGGKCGGYLLTIPGFNHDLTKIDFEVDLETLTNGRQQGKERISSLHEIRQLENRSLQLAANGEGEPMIFRHLSQDSNHKKVHTLTGSKYERGRAKPKPSRRTLSGLPIRVSATSEPTD